jgi:hypothetical protein
LVVVPVLLIAVALALAELAVVWVTAAVWEVEIVVVSLAVIASATAVWETVQQIVERLAVIAGAVLRAVSAGAHQASDAAVDTVAGVAQVVALVAEVAAVVVVVAVAVVVVADSNSRKGESNE